MIGERPDKYKACIFIGAPGCCRLLSTDDG